MELTDEKEEGEVREERLEESVEEVKEEILKLSSESESKLYFLRLTFP